MWGRWRRRWQRWLWRQCRRWCGGRCYFAETVSTHLSTVGAFAASEHRRIDGATRRHGTCVDTCGFVPGCCVVRVVYIQPPAEEVGDIEGGDSSWLKQTPDTLRMTKSWSNESDDRQTNYPSLINSIFEAKLEENDSLDRHMLLCNTLGGLCTWGGHWEQGGHWYIQHLAMLSCSRDRKETRCCPYWSSM